MICAIGKENDTFQVNVIGTDVIVPSERVLKLVARDFSQAIEKLLVRWLYRHLSH